MKEIYISTDVETDGPIPGDNSMLSIGAAAFTADGKMIDTFYATLGTLPGAKGDVHTMQWWAENQAAYDETRQECPTRSTGNGKVCRLGQRSSRQASFRWLSGRIRFSFCLLVYHSSQSSKPLLFFCLRY